MNGGAARCASYLLITLSLVSAPRISYANHSPENQEQSVVQQAQQALRGGDYLRAIELYRQVLATRPTDPTALRGLARAYLLSRQFAAAADTYRALLRQDSNNRAALVGLGEAYNFLREYRRAERPLKQVLRSAPDDADAAWALGRTYFYERRLGDAERLLKPAVAAHPQDYRLWESLGEVQAARGQNEDARQSLRRALDLNPKASRAENLLQVVENPKRNAAEWKAGFHGYAYLLADPSGNQILIAPQTLNLGYGDRWTGHLTGEYRRSSFHKSGLPTLAVGIASATASSEFRINRWVTIAGGGGTAQYIGQGFSRAIYHGGLTLDPTSRLHVSATYRQRIVAPTELAARLGITQQGWSGHLDYQFPAATNLDLGYYQDHLSDSNRLRGGYGEIRHVVWQKPVRITAGYELESLSFARLDLFDGYFSPKRFIAHTGLVNLAGRKGGFHYDYELQAGRETYTRPVLTSATPVAFAIERRSSGRFLALLRNSYELSPHWSVQFSFLLFHSALATETGAYHAEAALFGLTRSF